MPLAARKLLPFLDQQLSLGKAGHVVTEFDVKLCDDSYSI